MSLELREDQLAVVASLEGKFILEWNRLENIKSQIRNDVSVTLYMHPLLDRLIVSEEDAEQAQAALLAWFVRESLEAQCCALSHEITQPNSGTYTILNTAIDILTQSDVDDEDFNSDDHITSPLGHLFNR